ncbi:riboflavin biosynthesis pyrimidine reductase [Okibacterium sp. HSC-33S16]|uniref:pyrimidine reductase family protein n=1 Tax=Okibacterium sp. HSC-33S16 TaxID=2910965 RepID=UPI00209E0250|nr:pyrimidine reductase family protein [Okibacterium sp. HSC-33S16]MCP2030181.1 riboflavin biosynthesis pyrimidine reductase [Okibacterium sp. HSC-33S16]
MSKPRITLLQQSTADVTDEEILDLYSTPDRSSPWLRVNFISSIDGAATANGLSGDLGSPADRRVFDLLRRLSDVIVVGAGTVRAEGYGPMRLDDASVEWRMQHGLPPHPVFAIVSSSLNLDPESAIFTGAPIRPIVVTVDEVSERRRERFSEVADVLVAGRSSVDTVLMRQSLCRRGLTQMHCEGGPSFFADLIREDTVDELCLTVRSVLEGPGAPRIVAGAPVELRRDFDVVHALNADDALLLRYVRKAAAKV